MELPQRSMLKAEVYKHVLGSGFHPRLRALSVVDAFQAWGLAFESPAFPARLSADASKEG